jgi:hypothetical protein
VRGSGGGGGGGGSRSEELYHSFVTGAEKADDKTTTHTSERPARDQRKGRVQRNQSVKSPDERSRARLCPFLCLLWVKRSQSVPILGGRVLP